MLNTHPSKTRHYGISSILFLLSGLSGLIYEVIWFKQFSHIWGNSTLATAAVVMSFLFGLGLGAYGMGRLADRLSRPLFIYGLCELAIGILAFLITCQIPYLHRLSSSAYPFLQSHQVLHACMRFACTFLIIGPACILMGGTLPLLVRQFAGSQTSLRKVTGWLYAINTMGGALGCYLAGFHLLPSLGLFRSTVITAALNIGVGVLAMHIARRPRRATVLADALWPPSPSTEPAPANSHELPSGSMHMTYLVVVLTGFASLTLQMVWVRQLSLVLGGSTYAFTAVLFVFLIGIALGSLLFLRYLATYSDRALVPALLVAVIIVSVVLGFRCLPYVTYMVGLLVPMRSSQAGNALLCIVASSAIELIPAIGMGILFPFLVHLVHGFEKKVGRSVGYVYALNTVGAIAGVAVASLLLIPTLGTAGTTTFALVLYVLCLAALLPEDRSGGFTVKVAATVLCLGLIGLLIKPVDPRITNTGMYLYGYKHPDHIREQLKVVYFDEGPSCNVLVTEDTAGKRALRVNGKVDATSSGDMAMQLGLAYFPLFLYPDAREILNIGIGSGCTAGACLLFPQTHVTCCEIEPACVAASRHFSAVNHELHGSPRFTLVLDDGRSYLQGTEKRFDLILSEPSNPWIAGVSNLFTREFYEIAKAKLTPTGVLAQWLQLYAFSASEYSLVVRTAMEVFPNGLLVRVSEADTILLASAAPLGPTAAVLTAAQEIVDSQPPVKADLKQYFATTDVRALLVEHLVMETQGLAKLTATHSAGVNTDVNMRLEYDAPLRLYGKRMEQTNLILGNIDPQWFRARLIEPGGGSDQMDALHRLAMTCHGKGLTDSARGLTEAGLEASPQEPRLLALKQILDFPRDTKSFEESMGRIAPHLDEKEIAQIGVAMWRLGENEKAVRVFEALTVRQPTSATAWANLALACEDFGLSARAKELYEKAIQLDSINTFAVDSYERFLKR